MSRLIGAPELRARIRAIKLSFKPAGKAWADEVVRLARPAVPEKTGRLRKSFRVKNASQKRASVVGHYTASFIDAGTKAHVIKAKRAKSLRFEEHGRTIFSRRVNHPRTAGNGFRNRVAREALRREPMVNEVIKAWNSAKGIR